MRSKTGSSGFWVKLSFIIYGYIFEQILKLIYAIQKYRIV